MTKKNRQLTNKNPSITLARQGKQSYQNLYMWTMWARMTSRFGYLYLPSSGLQVDVNMPSFPVIVLNESWRLCETAGEEESLRS